MLKIEPIAAGSPESQSADLKAENIATLKALFPELLSERIVGGKPETAINVDVLKQLVGDTTASDGEEKYGLNWHGKRRARQIALTPSTGTLRPCPDESVDWDTTQNLMIEGDNLEVLKLLQKSYAGKVKLIYIDPPYNTGRDFVYPDNFQDNIKNYLELTGQVEGGRKITSNTEASGRFHTDWLNMMYPRLKLARSLMRDDAAIFISIDEGEVANLRKIGDEIFGEENFITNFIWEKRTNRENRKVVSARHDNIICYCRDSSKLSNAIRQLPMSEKALANYKNPDNDSRGAWKSDPATAQAGHGTKSQFYTFIAPNGTPHELESGRCWLYTKPVMELAAREGRLWFGRDGNGVPRIKTYLEAKDRGLTPETIWFAEDVGTNEIAKNSLKELFDERAVFDSPKPVDLIKQTILLSAADGLVLDFFAGAGTTGHAVLAQNSIDGGKRRFLLVQLPEECPENSEAQLSGLQTIADITKERLRRTAQKIKSENPLFAGDTGFRVFRLDTSNIRAWSPNHNDLEGTLLANIEHIQPGRSDTDVLYELLLKLGLDLCVPIETRIIDPQISQMSADRGKDESGFHLRASASSADNKGFKVHSIGGGVLMACLESRIAVSEAEALALGMAAWRKEQAPAGDTTAVFRDSAFENDVAKSNLAAILQQHGIGQVRSL